MPKILTIAGSDAGGGAGIQADLKTFQEFNAFGISAITSVVTFNPDTLGSDVFLMPSESVDKQLITGFSADHLAAIKIGMLGQTENIAQVAYYLQKHKPAHLVIDPVMAVKSTTDLFQSRNVADLVRRLFPLATVVTPNLIEAQVLAQMPAFNTLDQLKRAAKTIHDLGPKYVVIKGGSRFPGDQALDLLYDGTNFTMLTSPKLDTDTTHGAGCSFAATITAGLANGLTVKQATYQAKDYVHVGIQQGVYLNKHVGYLWHGAYRNQLLKKETESHDEY
ncbi:bifunctional hydroxymethylpyrimidine kinase/phosphomethylpyrimidine kinase [Vagococcus penaei]|uniref:pyridoxal kinase n=1 Tax=Vagococcus penaei TaxID=633807 RepID=A0A1Q2D8M4_9ENTE|nr:bifunctional hydroxymethylpyrimidine kinase/phosphomethylpyrimidine kinase [Vagococcus penaei]RSU00432.1 bifunctional hydroxymethylpyrimidine kinase/phosphomethylpyrimidine kinase [Vagococcus penaei]